MANKKQQNDQINVEDALDRSQVFFDKNKKAIIGALVALVLVIGGYFMYKNMYQAPREEKAQAALFKGETFFRQNQFELALNGDSISYKGFVKVADEFSGTDAANLANAYAGICYARLGKFDEAVKYLDKFSAGDHLVSPAIKAAMGSCYVEMNKLDKAVSLLVDAADDAESEALSPIYLLQAGQIYVKMGQFDKAVSTFNVIKNDYPRSMQARDIDKYIEQAKMLKK